jgi:large subunit ribosomal protein L18
MMALGPTYKVKFRRRRDGKTDYYRRRRLLLSRKPRLVVRKTNTKVIVQFIKANVIGDSTVASALSTELVSHGLSSGTGNMPAAYLTGMLAGLRAKARGIDSAVLDIGLIPPVKGSKIYAVLKGVLEAGLDIPHNPEALPDDDRTAGKHIVDAFQYFSESSKETPMFSIVGKKKTNITSIQKKFETVKKALLAIPKADLKKMKKKTPAKAKAAATKKPAKTKRDKPTEKAPRAVPRKPKPKKLIARGKGKKGKRKTE